MDLTDTQLDRYARHIILRGVGGPGQRRLLQSSVLVVGAGGLGCPIIAYLAAAGVGRLGLVDDDRVDLSNLQRQILFRTDDIGRYKADVAAKFATDLNSDCKAYSYKTRLDGRSAPALIADYDLIIDGTDNFATRLTVSDACVAAGKPLISAAIAQFEGQVMGFSGQPGDACYRCFVPQAPEDADTCESVGVLGALAGVVGSMAALEAVKYLSDAGPSLMGQLLLYDGLSQRQRLIRIPHDPACPACAGEPGRQQGASL